MKVNSTLVQSLLDAGYGVNKISKMFSVRHEIIRRVINRFNLEVYEAFDENTPIIERTWVVDNAFRVRKSIIATGYKYKTEAMRNAISELVMAVDPDEITSKLLKEYRHISVELQRKVDAFIRKTSDIKFGGAA